MDDDLKAKLTLEAQATGGDELRAMAEQVRALGQDAGASAPKLNALAAVLDHVADQQQLIDSFKAGKRAVAELEAQMGAAATQVEQLAAEQERAAQAAAAAAAAQANGARQLEAARAAQQGYKDAIAAARATGWWVPSWTWTPPCWPAPSRRRWASRRPSRRRACRRRSTR